MAPKTNRGEKRSKQNEDTFLEQSSLQRRFVSRRCKEMFDYIKQSRKPISERGFDLERGDNREVFAMIANRGWEKYCEPPTSANISMVREFYANAIERNEYQVFVRGKLVSFDPVTINKYFNLGDLPDPAYQKLEVNHDLTDILRTLCDTEVRWKISRGEVKSFLSNCLSLQMTLWYLFITARLMPVTHISDVTKERAILLYAIKRGIFLNIGKMICRAIVGNITATRVGLYFPSLISDLCIKAEVPLRTDDEWKQPTQPINSHVIYRLNTNKSLREGPSGTTRQEKAKSESKSKSVKPLTMHERMSRVESKQEELQEWATYQTSFNEYQAESMSSMNNLIRGMATHMNLDMSQYPSSSVCPQHYKFKERVVDEQEGDEDEEDEEGEEDDEDEDDYDDDD